MFFCHPSQAFSQPFIYPGIQTSIESGLSQTNTRGAAAALSNPANIVIMQGSRSETKSKSSRAGVEVYGDFSLMNVDYIYERSGYDPVRVSLTATPISVGMAWRPSSKFAVGLLFVPRPASGEGNTIENVPIQQGREIMLVNVSSTAGTAITAAGLSFKPSGNLTLGIGFIETAETNTTAAKPVEDAETDPPLLQMSFSGEFIQFIAGARGRLSPNTIFGGSFKSSVIKKYSGEMSLSGSNPVQTTKQDYIPSTFAIGLEQLMNTTVIFGEYRREGWASGGSQVRSGTLGSPNSKDLKDVNILIGGGRYQWGKGHAIGASVGRYPANVGFGSAVDADGQAISGEMKSGVELGDFYALDRTVFAFGYRANLTRGYFSGGVNMQNGSRSVPLGYLGSGKYALSVFTIALGGAYGF